MSVGLVLPSDEMHLNPFVGLAVMLFYIASFHGCVSASPKQARSSSATLFETDPLSRRLASSSSLTLKRATGENKEEPHDEASIDVDFAEISVQRRQNGLTIHCHDICLYCRNRQSLRISALCAKQCPRENAPEFQACLTLYVSFHPRFQPEDTET